MTAEIIDLAAHREPTSPGNGAREALVQALLAVFSRDAQDHCVGCDADDVLANLWFVGFKIVPVEDNDA